MKRKKQLANDDVQSKNSKRIRSGTRDSPVADVDEERYTITKVLPARRQSRNAVEEDLTPEVADSIGGSEDEVPDQESSAEEGIEGNTEEAVDEEVTTPVKNGNSSLNGTPSQRAANRTPTAKLYGKKLFSTPVKFNGTSEYGTPKLERHADRSARRKSTRTLIERTVLGNTSDNDEEDEDIAQHIYGFEEEDEAALEELGIDGEPLASEPTTPSKRGRPKGSRTRKRSPTPPQDLPPHELYFFQNRGGRPKTPNNNLASLKLLDHEEYFKLVREYTNPHAEDLQFREELLTKLFSQWHFELGQDFNLCLYGWGSKRSLIIKFAEHIYKTQNDHVNNKIVIVNGYVHNLTIKDVLNTVVSAIAERGTKLGSQPAEMLENLIVLLKDDPAKHITLIIHSIDGSALRRPTTQTILSRLSSLPQIHLVASADHPSFPLLWDSSLRSTFNFLFHDCTTFQPYTSEVDVVDEVHELLGRSSRRVGGKEGVIFVLKSLTENARKLFKALITEQLATMDDSITVDADDDDDERSGQQGRTEPGVEWRVLYQKSVVEFICGNEMAFRTLLKEFYDHQMIQSRKDALGTEIISAPFRKEELENIIEDIGV